MSHKRQDTHTKPIEWAKHLRPDGKRRQAKAERTAASNLIGECIDEAVNDDVYAENAHSDDLWSPEPPKRPIIKKPSKRKKYKLLAIAKPEFLKELEDNNSWRSDWFKEPSVLGKYKTLDQAEQAKTYHEGAPNFYNSKKFTFEIIPTSR